MYRQKGFSLVELLIVVAIILVIAVMAVPSLLSSRIAANEASAVASLRTINNAEFSYSASYPTAGYATALGILGPGPVGNTIPSQNNAALLDDVLGCNTATASGGTCTKSGYSFSLSVANATAPVTGYSINANPLTAHSTGTRYFYSDESALVRFNMTTVATAADSNLQ